VINQLAQQYSNQPVVFVDYHYSMEVPQAYLPPESRWEVIQATEEGLGLTWAVVDSGRLHHRGAETTAEAYNAYTTMIDDALSQPATAEINAAWGRIDNTVVITATVTNNSAITLSTANNAGVYGIVKENGVQYEDYTTLHPGLNAAKEGIGSLEPGDTVTYTINVPDINPTDWSKVEVIVLVDYQTAPDAAYNQLQATIATPAIWAEPNDFLYFIDDDQSYVPNSTTTITGYEGLFWSASSIQPWLALSTFSGASGDTITMFVNGDSLNPGWNIGVMTVTESNRLYTFDVTLRIYKASPGETINRIYLPVINRP